MNERLEFIKAAMQSLIVTSNATTLATPNYAGKIARAAVMIGDATLAEANSTGQNCSPLSDKKADMERAIDLQKGEQIGER